MRCNSSTGLACLAGISLLVGRASGLDSALPETEGAVRTWRSADGLPADSVTAIIQTRDGFLWVGTSAGLVRFDGFNFTSNAPIRVTALCEDSDGHVWIGSQQDGLFELSQGRLRRYTKARGLLDDSVTTLAADGQGQVWIGTKSGLNLSTKRKFRSLTTRDGLPDDFVSGVHVARSGAVWIATRGGICQFIDGQVAPYPLQTESQGRNPEYLGAYEDRRGNLWAYGDTYLINTRAEDKRFNYFRGNEAASVRIWSFCEGRDGRLWIGTSGRGLFCFDGDRFQQVILSELRWPYDVRAIYEDREGNLWLGTSGGGLVQLRPQAVHILRTEQGLPSSSPTALALDAKGRLHVGLARGGLFVNDMERFEPLPGLEVQDFVSSVCVDRDGTVWAGTLGGGLYGLRNGRGIRFTTANGLADDSVLSVCVDAEGSVWAGTSAGTVHRFTGSNTKRYDTASGLPGSPVTAMLPSAAAGLWVGAADGSILRREADRFVLTEPAEKTGGHAILAMQESDLGRLWIGTSGGGLVCLTGNARVSWNTGNGLPSDVVAGVVEDGASNLWLVTGAGIYRVDRAAIQAAISDPGTQLVCKLMSDAKTAYESTVFGGVRALLASEERLWLAASDGLLTVNTRRPEIESAPLAVYIESVSFNGRPATSLLRTAAWSSAASSDAAVTVQGDLRSMEVRFTALNFSWPEQIRFRYKLEGSDADWVESPTARVARYGHLSYGNYRFRVAAARIAEGAWQEAATPFAFTVPTPLHLRPWAIALYSIAAVALVAGIVRVVSHRRLRRALAQMEQQQSLERERMRIARDMHDEIGSKLTKISFLSEHARVNADSSGPLAGKIESIAETSRELLQTMDEIVWVVNPRNDTLEHLAAYLGHYAAEYFQSTSIECDLRLPRAIPHFPLSSEARHNLFLAFEEALNNVLKHAAATKVKIEMNANVPEFEINVTDNGTGFDLPAVAVTGNGAAAGARGGPGGNGLRNMRQRLTDIGGECRVRSQPGGGTTVSLRFRLRPSSTLGA